MTDQTPTPEQEHPGKVAPPDMVAAGVTTAHDDPTGLTAYDNLVLLAYSNLDCFGADAAKQIIGHLRRLVSCNAELEARITPAAPDLIDAIARKLDPTAMIRKDQGNRDCENENRVYEARQRAQGIIDIVRQREITARADAAEAESARLREALELSLCSDCPRAGHSTDHTRCENCPRAALSLTAPDQEDQS